jgi:hypothetical protein
MQALASAMASPAAVSPKAAPASTGKIMPGMTLTEMRAVGTSPAQLIQADYSLAEIHTAGYTAKETRLV